MKCAKSAQKYSLAPTLRKRAFAHWKSIFEDESMESHNMSIALRKTGARLHIFAQISLYRGVQYSIMKKEQSETAVYSEKYCPYSIVCTYVRCIMKYLFGEKVRDGGKSENLREPPTMGFVFGSHHGTSLSLPVVSIDEQ